MLLCLRLKFRQNPRLRECLLSTQDAVLVEGNTWHDNYWGNCRCRKCRRHKGLNRLGRLLMQVRAEIGAKTAE